MAGQPTRAPGVAKLTHESLNLTSEVGQKCQMEKLQDSSPLPSSLPPHKQRRKLEQVVIEILRIHVAH